MFELDASGLSCPEPVILLKKAVREYDEVRLTVDVTGGGGVYTLDVKRVESDRSGG